ncbi:GtrA family protein [Nocardia cyriacigeorgica]|uniref:GtrA family protein n=1 Tax=Nocardia cyriacigeorgica TaxID=135487 RepID=UPI00158A9E73|nr:GtrA family protein [Nocardia cyriacigeorgica]
MDRPLHSLLTGAGPVASFLRFAGIGCSIGLISSVAVTLLGLAIPFALANALITVGATLLGTQLHARFTFAATEPAGGWQHLQSAVTAAAAYALTGAAMLLVSTLCQDPSIWTEQAVYLAASALAGVLRFAVLRILVFGTGPRRIAVPQLPTRLAGSGFGPTGAVAA